MKKKQPFDLLYYNNNFNESIIKNNYNHPDILIKLIILIISKIIFQKIKCHIIQKTNITVIKKI